MDKEIWKDVVGYKGAYMVSNMGRAKSLKRKSVLKGIILKQCLGGYGYHIVHLSVRGNDKNYMTHHLVCSAFLGERNGLEINHKNGDKSDNRLCNLEYVTHSQNIKHAYDTGLIKNKNKSKPKLKRNQVLNIRRLSKRGVPLKEIANKYKISEYHANRIINNVCWKKIK